MQKLSHIQRSRRSDQSLASQPGVKTFTEGEGEGEGEGFARTDFMDAHWGLLLKLDQVIPYLFD